MSTLPKDSAFRWAVLVLPLGCLWFRLVYNLQVEWETNPQYSYGYIVPFLCLGLLFHRWSALRTQPSTFNPASGFSSQVSALRAPLSAFCFLLFGLLSFLYLPTRLVELATPERERWIVQTESFYDARGRVYLELADATPAEAERGMAMLKKLAG